VAECTPSGAVRSRERIFIVYEISAEDSQDLEEILLRAHGGINTVGPRW